MVVATIQMERRLMHSRPDCVRRIGWDQTMSCHRNGDHGRGGHGHGGHGHGCQNDRKMDGRMWRNCRTMKSGRMCVRNPVCTIRMAPGLGSC